MPAYSKNEVVLVRYPFSNLTGAKVRPAIVVSASHVSQDVFIVLLTSRTDSLLPGEFALEAWQEAGLNIPSVVKRGLYTIHESLVLKSVGRLMETDQSSLQRALRSWLGMTDSVE